jgi:thioredoxin-dependent peroxiredoxin
MANLSEGAAAPQFTGNDQDGRKVDLKDFRGKKVILYFYPEDDTPGCTTEACNLRDNYDELLKRGFAIIGVSPDSEKSHVKFRTKFNLPFSLVADTDKKIIEAYNAWGEKTNFGRTYQGVLRKTYIIDEAGKILRIITKVDTADHTKQILDLLGIN